MCASFYQVTSDPIYWDNVKKDGLCLISLSGINPRIHFRHKGRILYVLEVGKGVRGGCDHVSQKNFNNIHVPLPLIFLATVNNGFVINSRLTCVF